MQILFYIILSIVALRLNALPADSAYIKFKNLKERFGADYYFRINGKVLKSARGKFKIPVNQNNLDTFIVSTRENFPKKFIIDSALAKFKKGEVYIIEFKCCDLPYEIYPSKNRKMGKIRFHTPNKDSTSCIINNKKIPLKSNTFNEYETYIPYFPDRIYRPLKFTFYYYIGQIKSAVLFLHGELYSATFDLKNKKVQITLDGLIK